MLGGRRFFSSGALKIIALTAMFIDHFAAVFLYNYIRTAGESGNAAYLTINNLVVFYYICRIVGRIAFPIYIFLLVEGLTHTRNQWKYALRMFVFAIISEIPFDLCFNISKNKLLGGQFIEFGYQNVFFTLFIGLLVIIGIKEISCQNWNNLLKGLCKAFFIAAGALLAWVLKTDYSVMGVIAIAVMYIWKERRGVGSFFMCIVLLAGNLLEFAAFPAIIPISMYNGRKGISCKWLFYVFYLVHLFILWAICMFCGIL